MKRNSKETPEEVYSKIQDLDYRKQYGQFFTPPEIGNFMSQWILAIPKSDLKILDPAAGFGLFPRVMKSIKSKKSISYDLWEVDKNIAEELENITIFENINANVYNKDFLNSGWSKKYDGIIANPPYFKHHFLKNKIQLNKLFFEKTKHKFSLKTNIYCLFLIKSLKQLKIGGRLAFIIPSEFLNSNYGEHIKKFLLNSNLNLNFIGISFEESVFDDATTTSVIVLAEKKSSKTEYINFYNANNLSSLKSLKNFLSNNKKIQFHINEINTKTKWRNYFLEIRKPISKNLIKLSEFGKFKRGIATGANNFFTLNLEEINDLNLLKMNLIPCITKSSHVEDTLFNKKQFEKLCKSNKKTYLFDGEKNENKFSKKYLKMGENLDIHLKYLTKNRSPWYSIEKRNISKIWISVFSRDKLKIIWNDTECLTLACFHTFYPTNLGKKYLKIIFLYLQTDLAQKLLNLEKREYGNGLVKFEPNDLNKALILDFRLLTKDQIKNLNSFHTKYIRQKDKKERQTIITNANQIFLSIN